MATLKQHQLGPVWCLRFHPTAADLLWSGAADGLLLQWDFNPRRHPRAFCVEESAMDVTVRLRYHAPLLSFDFHEAASTLVLAYENSALRTLPVPLP
jgi:hypothetical protein